MSRKLAAVLGFAGGAIAGTLVGVLYAPEKGRHTRDRLNYQLDKTRNRLQKIIDDLTASSNEIPVSSAQEKGRQVIEDVQHKAEQLLYDVDTLIEQIRTQK